MTLPKITAAEAEELLGHHPLDTEHRIYTMPKQENIDEVTKKSLKEHAIAQKVLPNLWHEAKIQCLEDTVKQLRQDKAELVGMLKECQRQCWVGTKRRNQDPLLQQVKAAIAKAGKES